MLIEATNSLIETARDGTATDADMNSSAQSFFDAIRVASPDDVNAALRTLSAHFDLENASRGAFLALVCGALVERGCDPLAIAKPLTERLASLLESSAELANACADQIAESEDKEEDPIERFEKTREQLVPTMAQQNAAWKALEQFWRPAIAVFSISPESRSSARHLRNLAAQISDYHDAGHWLQLMLAVLDDEPIVAIEPKTNLGILGRISGVVDNFQLNVLLMDAFPKSGFLARRRVPQEVADVARGNGPQQSHHTVTSVWNLYTWAAIEAGMVLPDPGDYGSSAHWVWNEGTPADIPVLDGHRVILLGPASYPRSWQSQRMFDNLRGNLEIERTLTKDEISEWLQRMIAAKNAS
jgi:hypothetical protein